MRLLRSSRFLVACGLVMLFIIGTMVGAERSASTMASAANHFLASLTPDQRAQAVFDFHSDERVKFHFIPMEQFPRNGLTIGAMTDAQRAHAHDLLSAGLSQRGYLTATTIMDLETILSALEPDGRFDRNSELYFFSVFGTPSSEGAWGWRVEGHHVSLHFTIVDGTAVASAPSFLGANPAQVRSGPKAGLRALREHEDAGRALVKALDPSQRDAAVILARLSSLSSRLYDSGSVAELTVDPISPVGVKAAALNPDQRALLMDVIRSYTSLMADDIAAARMEKIHDAGVDEIGFAWAGPIDRGEQHYYRIQGPTFLIEYDNSQGDGNHIHSVWRDFTGDFGRDLLREHLQASAH
jgi:hypothetical protein